MFGLGPAELGFIGFVIGFIAVAVVVIATVLIRTLTKSNIADDRDIVLTELREIKAEITEIKTQLSQ